jgi:hypothetical protein
VGCWRFRCVFLREAICLRFLGSAHDMFGVFDVDLVRRWRPASSGVPVVRFAVAVMVETSIMCALLVLVAVLTQYVGINQRCS